MVQSRIEGRVGATTSGQRRQPRRV